MTNVPYLNLREQIEDKIKENGGWVNGHAHLDRAYSISPELYKLANAHRHEKWKLNAELRRNSTVDDVYGRMAQAVETLLAQGVTATATYIDVDPDIKDRSIKASQKIKDRYGKDIIIKTMNQSSYGLFDPEAKKWFDYAMDYVDIVGGLLKADQGRENEHLDILFSEAKKRNKMVHIHVDELNIPEEKETEMVVDKIIEHGLQGKVVGIHGISINCKPKKYREALYKKIKAAEMMFVACPMSWIDARRSEEHSPIHNPVLPLDEMHPYGITVAVGLDNIADLFKPYNDANMWNDLRLLFETNRFYDVDEIVKIATVNGRKVLGIE
ncbi:amidohydrolase family protein [Candidatus Woesebacteria bacterium]|nr:amidohydrolase family protein [Candidatus Woesebacteria bacterium]